MVNISDKDFNKVIVEFEQKLFTTNTFDELSQLLMLLNIFGMSNKFTVKQMKQIEALSCAYDIKLDRIEDEEEEYD